MSDPIDISLSRRGFLAAAAGGLIASAADPAAADPAPPAAATRPVAVASANGLASVARAFELMRDGTDPLDAAVAGVAIVEDDPNDHSVGFGGLPNEDGVVELDASVMHGPTHKAGAVAALRNIRNPSKVARLVMQRTDHVLLVGEGALRFAKAHGFKEEELLTDEARRMWLRWKERLSEDDDWLPPEDSGGGPRTRAKGRQDHVYGTINCCAVDAAGNIGGVTTTSGLAYKIPGRVGDSPIIGAGLYVDNAVGAAGSTGRGEANLQNCSSFLVVELMRAGKSPQDACLEVLRRVADHAEPRLRDSKGRPTFGLSLYAVAKDGRYGSANIWSGTKFAVADAAGARLEKAAFLYKKD